MSQSSSHLGDAACASPESPTEGDFSPRQLRDNPRSLEEHDEREDQEDPGVSAVPDDGFLLNTQICAKQATNDLGKLCAGTPPQEKTIKKSSWKEQRCFSTSPIRKDLTVSPEFTEVRTPDGRFITAASTRAQTDWEWAEQGLSFSCQVQKETEDPRLLQAEVSEDADPDSSQVACSWQKASLLHSQEQGFPCVGPPRLIAFKPEPKQTLHVGKVPEVESKQDAHLAQCDYCQQLCRPFMHGELLGNETDFERLFCCERANQMRGLILEEREKLAQRESDKKIDVNPHAPIVSEEEREAAREKAKERLRRLQRQRKSKAEKLEEDLSVMDIKHKTSFRPLKKSPHDEPHILRLPKNTTGVFTPQQQADGDPKLKEAMRKFYKSGGCFLTLFPDGTGNVFYPSGKAAIIISSTEAADFTYIILEDKDGAPNIKGIFTNKGHSTCYHPNGMIWLNLTPVGGLCLSETGALRRRWNWFYFDQHVRNLPFKPLTFALGPHISVRIHSQEHMYVTFAHRQSSMRFSVGSKPKLMYSENHDRSVQDVTERYIQMKSSEIYSLLGQMQTCMSHRNSFVFKTKLLNRQMETEKSSEREDSCKS